MSPNLTRPEFASRARNSISRETPLAAVAGGPRSRLWTLVTIGLFLLPAGARAQSDFEIIWDDFNCASGDLAGPRYQLSGTFGQGDAVVMTSARYRMVGGFHNPFSSVPCVGDLDGNRDIDLADLARLLGNFGTSNVSFEDGDIDGDHDVDLSDLSTLLSSFGTNCPQ